MTTVEYYRRSISLPLLLPVMAIPQYVCEHYHKLDSFVNPLEQDFPSVLSALATFLERVMNSA